MQSIGIVIPAYNEKDNILKLIKGIRKKLIEYSNSNIFGQKMAFFDMSILVIFRKITLFFRVQNEPKIILLSVLRL